MKTVIASVNYNPRVHSRTLSFGNQFVETLRLSGWPACSLLNPGLLVVAWAALLAGPGISLFAQQKEKVAAALEETVELLPFVVTGEGDTGYQTKNAVSGTRANVPVKDLPISISIITKELLEDLNVSYGNEALRYAPSASSGIFNPSGANSPGASSRGDTAFRGFGSSNNFRDGIRAPGQSAMVNTERVEIINGPSSITYGITPPGGIYNTITKSPIFDRSFLTLFAAYDGIVGNANYGDRLMLDHNWGVKGNPFAARLAMGYSNVASIFDTWSDISFDRTYAPSVSWRPLPKTNVTFKYEHHARSDLSGGRILFKSGSNGASFPVQEYLRPDIPRTWNYLGPESLQSRKSNVYTLKVDQRISDKWQVQALYSRFGSYVVNADVRQFLAADPVTNVPDTAVRLNRQYNPGWQTQRDLLLTSLWKFDVDTPLGRVANSIVVSYQSTDDHTDNINTAILGTNGRRYDAFAPLTPGFDIPSLFVGRPYSIESTAFGDNISSVYSANWQARFAEDRVLVTAAASRVKIDQQPSNYHITATKPLIGIMYRPRESLSFFLLDSATLFPSGQRDENGRSFKPSSGVGLEGGLKIDAFDSRVSGTISIYENSNKDTVLFDPNFVNPLTGARGRNFQAGRSKSKGGEIDLIISPRDNWQVILGYGQHVTKIVSDINPALVGTLVSGAGSKHKITSWSKYSFKEGGLKNFSVAGGVIYNTKQLRGYSSGVPRFTDGYWDGDLRLAYRLKVRKQIYDLALQMSNIFGQQVFDSPGWVAPSPGAVATVPIVFDTPRSFSFSVRAAF